MADRVLLPADELIEYRHMARAVAQAVCPVVEHGATGMSCVMGKFEDWGHVLGYRTTEEESRQCELSVDLAWDDCPINFAPFPDSDKEHGLAALQSATMRLPFPLALTEKERQLVEAMLPALPPLIYPMSDVDRATFVLAFRKLKDSLCLVGDSDWEPILLTEGEVELRRKRHERYFREQLRVLSDEVSSGRMIACTRSHLPVRTLCFDALIPRQSAIDYLRRHGFAYCVDDFDAVPRASEGEREAGGGGGDNDATPASSEMSEEGPRMSESLASIDGAEDGSRAERIYEFFVAEEKRQKADKSRLRKNHTQVTAAAFCVSSSWVRRVVRNIKKKRLENRLDVQLARR